MSDLSIKVGTEEHVNQLKKLTCSLYVHLRILTMLLFDYCILPVSGYRRIIRGSLLLQHAPATCSHSKATSSVPTI